MFSYFNGTLPAIFEDRFTKKEHLHNYNTRSDSNTYIDISVADPNLQIGGGPVIQTLR